MLEGLQFALQDKNTPPYAFAYEKKNFFWVKD